MKKIKIGELRVIIVRALDTAWKNLCKTHMMRASFRDVGLSLNIDGSEDYLMKFQGQPRGRPTLYPGAAISIPPPGLLFWKSSFWGCTFFLRAF